MTYPAPDSLRTVAMLGMGSIGSSWTALMLARGISVRAFDPADGAVEKAHGLISGCWPALQSMGLTADDAPDLTQLTFVASVEEAAAGAELVFENAPEDLALKHDVLRQADAVCGPEVLLLSSAGGLPPSAMQSVCAHPERVLVLHPFNPAHLIPLVEIVPGKDTAPEATEWTAAFARLLGKKPVIVAAERSGHMVNRLQFALVREAAACLADGVASAADIDAAVRYGLAPRWLLQGGLQTVAMAGGPGGMKGILDHAGAAMEQWWDPGAPRSIADVYDAMIGAADVLQADVPFEDWAAWRDARLVELFNAQADADAARPGADQKGSQT